MTRPHEDAHYLILPSVPATGGAASEENRGLAAAIDAGRAALVAALSGAEVEPQLDALTSSGGESPEGAALRLAVSTPHGPRIVIAARIPARRSGPGAPSDLERLFEVGWRLGGAAPGGVLHWPAPGPPASDAAAASEVSARTEAKSFDHADLIQGGGDRAEQYRAALWRGVALGSADPAAAGSWLSDEAGATALPRFGGGEAVSPETQRRYEGQSWVRRMVECPPNLLGPAEFAAQIAIRAKQAGVACEIWDRDDLIARGFGATLGVSAGSVREPRVVHLSWGSDAGVTEPATLGLVGKGITFDSGGLNVKKDPGELAWMKADMAAAAAVAEGLIIGVAEGALGAIDGRRVEAILPLCDNTISGAAQRPGDVVVHPDGATSEVVDTDCEGRLVLADGITWCRQAGHAAIVDSGTLTDGGAGLRSSGLWSNNEGLAEALCDAGARAIDPVWGIPLPYGEEGVLASRVAERRNAPLDRPDVGRHAASYLAGFAGPVPWAHVDIGGTAYLEAEFAGRPPGATGAATLACAELVGAWLRGESVTS